MTPSLKFAAKSGTSSSHPKHRPSVTDSRMSVMWNGKGSKVQPQQYKVLTLLYFCKDGVFRGGPAKGLDTFVSRNFSDKRPPITVPYLHQGIVGLNFECMFYLERGREVRRQGADVISLTPVNWQSSAILCWGRISTMECWTWQSQPSHIFEGHTITDEKKPSA